MVTSPLAKNRRLYAFTVGVVAPDADYPIRLVYRADTPDGVVEIGYDATFVQGVDPAPYLAVALTTFETDLTAMSYVLI